MSDERVKKMQRPREGGGVWGSYVEYLDSLERELEELKAWQAEVIRGYEFATPEEMLAWVRSQLGEVT